MRRFSLLSLLLLVFLAGATMGVVNRWHVGRIELGDNNSFLRLVFSVDSHRLFAKERAPLFIINVADGTSLVKTVDGNAEYFCDGPRMFYWDSDSLTVTDEMSGKHIARLSARKPKEWWDPAEAHLKVETIQAINAESILVRRDDNLVLRDFPEGNDRVSQLGLYDLGKSASFSLNGDLLVGIPARQSQEAYLLDGNTLELLHTFTWKTAYFTSISFSPDGSRILTSTYWRGEDESAAQVWDATTFKNLLVLRGHADGVTDAAWSPDGRRIATTCWDGKVRVFDANSGVEIARSHRHNRETEHVTFSPDGRWIASSDRDGVIELWNGGWLTSRYRQFGLPELWATIVLAVLFLWSLRRDWKRQSVLFTLSR